MTKSFQLPYQLTDAIFEPLKVESVFSYLNGRLGEELPVLDCNVLLGSLDVVGRHIATELQKGVSESRGIVLLRQKHLARCDYLADQLRAKRRRVVVCEMQRFLAGRRPSRLVDSVVIPMLSRRWLPAMFYEPAIGAQRKDVEAWQGPDVPPFKKDGSELFQYRGDFTRMLSGAWLNNTNRQTSLLSIISALRSWDFDAAPSQETASYLHAALRVHERDRSAHRRTPLEVPVLLARRNQSEWQPGHVVTALLVPFEVPCTSALTKESLLPAMDAVNSHFSGAYRSPEVCHLLVGDYPGGAYCPGNAVCAEIEHGSEGDCSCLRSSFEGPSVSPALGALLAADAMGLEIRSHRYTTAKLAPSGRIDALSTDRFEGDDSYLQAKGRTMALLAHASGQEGIQVVVNSQDLAALLKGAERYREDVAQVSPCDRTAKREADWAVSWQAASSLRDTLDYFLPAEIEGCVWPGIYSDLIANLNDGGAGGNVLAKAAARQILTDVDVDRWIVSVPAQTQGIEGTGGFEMDLAREVYRLSTSLGMVRVPVRVSAPRFLKEYAVRYPISLYRTQGLLGETVAGLGGISLPEARTEQRKAWTYQVERDLHEGRLILMIGNLWRDDPDGRICDRMRILIDSLCSQRNAESQWDVKNIVAVTPAAARDSQRNVCQVFEEYGFRECKLEDDAIPGQVLV